MQQSHTSAIQELAAKDKSLQKAVQEAQTYKKEEEELLNQLRDISSRLQVAEKLSKNRPCIQFS